MAHKKLVIITDTPMYKEGDGQFAFGPVVRELEFIRVAFDEIVWLGFERSADRANPIFDKIKDKRITILPVKPMGGKGWVKKLGVIIAAPLLALKIWRLIVSANIVHTRGPSSPAFIALLFAYVYKRKIWWNKYAGNWMQVNPPFLYGLQKKVLLTLKNTHVTFNGFWENQPKHCVSFENPCLYDADLKRGEEIARNKNFERDLELVFIGRLEEEKGVQRILDMLKEDDFSRVKTVHFIGDGPKRAHFEAQQKDISTNLIFHGFLNHEAVHQILAMCHFLILPSTASEGFPKVIAEASCYGCIPVVSDISSITHYVKNKKNGFVWAIQGSVRFGACVSAALNTDQENLHGMAMACNKMSEAFGFTAFLEKLKALLFKTN